MSLSKLRYDPETTPHSNRRGNHHGELARMTWTLTVELKGPNGATETLPLRGFELRTELSINAKTEQFAGWDCLLDHDSGSDLYIPVRRRYQRDPRLVPVKIAFLPPARISSELLKEVNKSTADGDKFFRDTYRAVRKLGATATLADGTKTRVGYPKFFPRTIREQKRYSALKSAEGDLRSEQDVMSVMKNIQQMVKQAVTDAKNSCPPASDNEIRTAIEMCRKLDADHPRIKPPTHAAVLLTVAELGSEISYSQLAAKLNCTESLIKKRAASLARKFGVKHFTDFLERLQARELYPDIEEQNREHGIDIYRKGLLDQSEDKEE